MELARCLSAEIIQHLPRVFLDRRGRRRRRRRWSSGRGAIHRWLRRCRPGCSCCRRSGLPCSGLRTGARCCLSGSRPRRRWPGTICKLAWLPIRAARLEQLALRDCAARDALGFRRGPRDGVGGLALVGVDGAGFVEVVARDHAIFDYLHTGGLARLLVIFDSVTWLA